MKSSRFYCVIAAFFLIPLAGCQFQKSYYITNTLANPCTIRLKLSSETGRKKTSEIAYTPTIIQKINSRTKGLLNQTLVVKQISPSETELVLPAQSTALIYQGSSASGFSSADSIFFISSGGERSYSMKEFTEKSNRFGGGLSSTPYSLLFEIK